MNTHKRPEIHARIAENQFLELQKIATTECITLSELIRKIINRFFGADNNIDSDNPLNQYYVWMSTTERIAYEKWKKEQSTGSNNVLEAESLIEELEIKVQDINQRNHSLIQIRDELFEQTKTLKDENKQLQNELSLLQSRVNLEQESTTSEIEYQDVKERVLNVMSYSAHKEFTNVINEEEDEDIDWI